VNVHAALELDWATDSEARKAAGWVAPSSTFGVHVTGTDGNPPERTEFTVLPCTCGWRSEPERPETEPLPSMQAAYDAHVSEWQAVFPHLLVSRWDA
jgi:hypothetical protein